MADHVIANTPEAEPARPRVSTKQRGGDIEPDGDQSPGRTDGPRGKMPKSNGGPPVPEPASVAKGPQGGDHLEAPVPAPDTVPPIATRRSADEPTGTNPLT